MVPGQFRESLLAAAPPLFVALLIVAMEELENKELEPFDEAKGDGEPFATSSRKNELLGSWKRRSKEFYNETSFHGILYVFASMSWIKRIFWALVILTATAGFFTVSIRWMLG